MHYPVRRLQFFGQKRMSRTRLLLTSACFLTLVACSDQDSTGAEIHDTKYRAVNAKGEAMGPEIAGGVCVLDQFTSLTWEAKTESAGLHHRDNTYTWFNPDEAHDGELDYRGWPDGGECTGSACDTSAFVAAVNQSGLCGYSDWRMPTRDELGSISDPRKGNNPPTINLRHFPMTQAGEYWSGNDYQFQWNTAWLWSFETGLDRVEWKQSPRYVRLVRGTPQGVERIED